MQISHPAFLWYDHSFVSFVRPLVGGELPVRLFAFARISFQRRPGRALYHGSVNGVERAGMLQAMGLRPRLLTGDDALPLLNMPSFSRGRS